MRVAESNLKGNRDLTAGGRDGNRLRRQWAFQLLSHLLTKKGISKSRLQDKVLRGRLPEDSE